MDTNESRGRVAEPAPEEIKKHGDQLRTQVADAAGKQVRKDGHKDGHDGRRDDARKEDGKDAQDS